MIDESWFFQYIVSIYWALQTLTTVGFGDITIITDMERSFAILWMIVGVAFYSYSIGTITNLVESLDASKEEMNEKIMVLRDLRKRTKMSQVMSRKIQKHLENNNT